MIYSEGSVSADSPWRVPPLPLQEFIIIEIWRRRSWPVDNILPLEPRGPSGVHKTLQSLLKGCFGLQSLFRMHLTAGTCE